MAIDTQGLVEIASYTSYLNFKIKDTIKINGENYEVKDFVKKGTNGLDMYLIQNLDSKKFTVMAQGSADAKDWENNLDNALGKHPKQYDDGLKVYNKWKKKYGKNLEAVSGNSLGGGLVMHIANLVGKDGTKFVALNPAKLSPEMLLKYLENDNLNIMIDDRDILNTLQSVLSSHKLMGRIYRYDSGAVGMSFEMIELGHKGTNDNPGIYNHAPISTFLTFDSISGDFIKADGTPLNTSNRIKISVNDYDKIANNLKKEANDYKEVCLKYFPLIKSRLEDNSSTFSSRRNKIEQSIVGAIIDLIDKDLSKFLKQVPLERYLIIIEIYKMFPIPNYNRYLSDCVQENIAAVNSLTDYIEHKIDRMSKDYGKFTYSNGAGIPMMVKTNSFIECVKTLNDRCQVIAFDIHSDIESLATTFQLTKDGFKNVDSAIAKAQSTNTMIDSLSNALSSVTYSNLKKKVNKTELLQANDFINAKYKIVERNYDEMLSVNKKEFVSKIEKCIICISKSVNKFINRLNREIELMEKETLKLIRDVQQEDKTNSNLYKLENKYQEIEKVKVIIDDAKDKASELYKTGVDISKVLFNVFKQRKKDLIDLLYSDTDLGYVIHQFRYVTTAQEQYMRLLKNTKFYISNTSDGLFQAGLNQRLDKTINKVNIFKNEVDGLLGSKTSMKAGF